MSRLDSFIRRLEAQRSCLAEAEIVEWKVSAGDTVSVDQVLLSVETAKALVDVPSPVAGVIPAATQNVPSG